jgi:protocatechuate 3,4-dioxygenase beta subunit
MSVMRLTPTVAVAACAGCIAAVLAVHAQSTTAIRGRVTSASGDPVEGATVRASLIRFQEGRRRAIDAGLPATSDDHGRYRIDGLAAGRYLVQAAAPSDGTVQSQDVRFVPLLPPQPAESKEILLGAGHTIDLDLTTPLPTARIAGRMLNAAGRPTTTTLLIVPSHRSGAVAPPPLGATIFPDGGFEFAHVPPGEYAVQALRTRLNSSTEGEFAGAYVQVAGADVTGVELKATAGSTIKGKLTFANDEPIPQGRFVVTPARADLDQTPFWEGELARSEVQNDLTFEIRGVHGPRRLLLGQAPAGWILKTVHAKGEDVTDLSLPFGTENESLDDVEIVVTSRVAELSGSAVDDRGQRATRYSLLAFPVDRVLWYPSSRFFRRAVPDAEGRFQIAAMTPGEYFIAAVSPFEEHDDSWQDPDSLERIAVRATRIVAVEATRLAVSIRLLR